METENLTSTIIGQHRPEIQQYGKFFGQQLFTVIKVNPDPKFKEDMLKGLNGLRIEIPAYLVKAVDVKSIEILDKDVDGRAKIMINGGKDGLVFELVNPEFTKATRENIAKCIENLSKPNNKPMFFAAEDLTVLSELVAIANQDTLKQYEEFARKFMSLSETVRGYMNANERIKTDYLRQCGVQDEADVTISVTVQEQ